MTRLFIAVWPPDDVLDRLGDLDHPRDQGVKWVPRQNLHVTMRFLGDADPDEVSARLDAVTPPAATAKVGPAFDVLVERSLVVPVGGVDALAATIRHAVHGLGTVGSRRPFLGHMTVARLARRARPARSIGQRFEATFPVTEVALVASTLADTGAEYETLATWPTR